MNIRRLLCVVLLGIGFASPVLAQESCAAKPVTSLPLLLQNNKVLVGVRVNDQPGFFILDTGGFASAVSERVVENLKLKTVPIRTHISIRDIGGERATRYAQAERLTIGNQLVSDERYMVINSAPGRDGLLAPDLLRNFDLDFDFAGRRVNLYRPRACAGKPPGSGSFSKVGMDVTKQGHIRIPVTLDGKRLMANVDTGAPSTAIIAPAARSNFGIRMGEKRTNAVGGAGGSVEMSPHEFQSLQIGDMVQQKPTLFLMDRDRAFEAAPILLGLEHLLPYRVFISYGERAFFLSRPEAGPVLGATEAIARAVAGNESEAAFSFVVQNFVARDGYLYMNAQADNRDKTGLALQLARDVVLALDARLGRAEFAALVGKRIRVTGVPRLASQPAGGQDAQVLIPVDDAARFDVLP